MTVNISLAFHHSPAARAYAYLHEGEIGAAMLKMRRDEAKIPVPRDKRLADLSPGARTILLTMEEMQRELTVGDITRITRISPVYVALCLSVLVQKQLIIREGVKNMRIYRAKVVA